jgi:hypothetical protein
MNRIFRLFLFFVFFVSFCIININAIDWGLQVSWFLGLILLVLYPLVFVYNHKIILTRNFRIVTIFFFIIIFITILSWILQAAGLIYFGDTIEKNDLFSRSFSHTIYFTFEYLLFIILTIYMQYCTNHIHEIKSFVIYPFFFIALWGIYQWFTTFDVLPYLKIFNNSLSTKFTYLRFKGEHRTSSVFPEPSEYAYFLAFVIPFAIECYFHYKDTNTLCRRRYGFIFLLLLSILLCQSMSLFIVIPIIGIYILRNYIKLSFGKIIIIFLLCIIVLGCLFIFKQDRFLNILRGTDGSAFTRFNSFFETITLIRYSPFIGAGFGAIRGLDLFSFMLSTTGLIGTIAFIWMIIKIKPETRINLIFVRGFKCMLIVALISNPILDLTFFWIVLAFICTPLYINNEF